jgi:hypothetical protein
LTLKLLCDWAKRAGVLYVHCGWANKDRQALASAFSSWVGGQFEKYFRDPEDSSYALDFVERLGASAAHLQLRVAELDTRPAADDGARRRERRPNRVDGRDHVQHPQFFISWAKAAGFPADYELEQQRAVYELISHQSGAFKHDVSRAVLGWLRDLARRGADAAPVLAAACVAVASDAPRKVRM